MSRFHFISGITLVNFGGGLMGSMSCAWTLLPEGFTFIWHHAVPVWLAGLAVSSIGAHVIASTLRPARGGRS